MHPQPQEYHPTEDMIVQFVEETTAQLGGIAAEIEDNISLPDNGVPVQTDMNGSNIEYLEATIVHLKEELQKTSDEVQRLNHIIEELRKTAGDEVQRLTHRIEELSWTEATFTRNDKKLLHFTGLGSMALFMLLVNVINDSLTEVRVRGMSNFQKLLLTLMKLRTNTSFVGLGYRFNIHSTTASSIFQQTIIVLECALHYVVHWPDRDCLRAVTPACFKENFGKSVAVIIDCFEIKIERPGTNRAKALTYSDYKHGHTVKYLIGITPHGLISYISTGWGGRTSDKKITEECGVLENLIPGDVLLADRGFTVNTVVAFHHAELKIPNFTKGKNQLHPREVENTRKIAAVRIHVERVIGTVRNKYKIMNGPIPLSLLKLTYEGKDFFDYIVRVCCILVNLSSSVVPLHR